MRRRPNFLVIGSAHLDVVGDFPPSVSGTIDKEGEVFCSVGGCAFNIAVNLINAGNCRAALFTNLRANSLVTDLIFQRLGQEGVSTRYVTRDSAIRRDSGFIAHSERGELVSAVSSMPIEDANLDKRKLKSAVRQSSMVVADCNLSATQLMTIVELCKSYDKKLVVSGVSESKATRVLPISDSQLPISVFSINEHEARSIFEEFPDSPTAEQCRHLCKVASAKRIVVTRGERGWSLLSSDGVITNFPVTPVPFVRSTSGAGDALVSVLARHVLAADSPDWSVVSADVDRTVGDNIRKQVASGSEMSSVETLELSRASRFRGFFGNVSLKHTAVVAVLIALVGLILAFVQTAVSLEKSSFFAPLVRNAICWFFSSCT